MRRVRRITAVGKFLTIKLTLELSSNKGTIPVRKQFLEMMDYYVGQAILGLANIGFPITKIKQK